MFSRILAATANADDERSRALIGAHYDAIAQRFVQAFRRVIPDLKADDAVWSYMFAIGVGMTMMAATGRAERLSSGTCDDRDVDAIMARIVPFISGGIKALAANAMNSEIRASAPPRRAGARGR